MAKIWIPLPDRDFDTTEVAVPWRLLTRAGHEVVFATEKGGVPPACDPLLLSGVLFGQLGAEPEPKAFYEELTRAPEYQRPLSWSSLEPRDYDGLILPGGHAPGMKQYLGSAELQRKVAEFFALDGLNGLPNGRPVGAICHGVLVAARAIDPRTGKSVIAERRTTCLPKYMERTAYLLTAWKLGRYYRTYPAYVEEEVKAALADPATQFVRGPRVLTKRGTFADDSPALVVEDGRYLSARWPGDAYLFTKKFAELVARTKSRAA
jgi:putative intracellular protease/amidase